MVTRLKQSLITQFGLAILLMLTIFLFFTGHANAQQNENPGTSQQPLVVAGPPVDAETREKFGLLTLNNPQGSCSASMLNDFWAITAAHCVFSPTTGAQFTPAQITLSASWPIFSNLPQSTKTAQVLRIIPYSFSAPWLPNDIALLQTGRNDFNLPRPIQRTLHDQRPSANLSVNVFGRGLNQFAYYTPASIAIPSSGDGQYRSAQFSISSIDPNSNLPPNTFSFAGKNGAMMGAGDSGGPAYVEEYDNNTSRRKLEWQLIGVFSACQLNDLPGQSSPSTNPWMWTASVGQCTDAAILPIRSQILAAIEQPPEVTGPTGTFPTTPPSTSHVKSDILWHNATTNETKIWLMGGFQVSDQP